MPRIDKTYDVLMTFAAPAWDERDGIMYRDIRASSKREANERARRKAYNDGHSVGVKVSFKATERVNEQHE